MEFLQYFGGVFEPLAFALLLGAKALQISFIASGIGGVIGVGLLIFLTPVLAQWALAFGPSHLFWMAILGVTVIGSLDSKSFVKGLLSGCIGLWLSMIGHDDIQGAQRFIFMKKKFISLVAPLLATLALGTATAGDYPDRPISVMVSYGAGGAAAMKAVIAGDVIAGINNLSDAYRAREAGNVKILAVADLERNEQFLLTCQR